MSAGLATLVGPPGSDRRGDAPRGAWLFLLPSLPTGPVPWFGTVPTATTRRLHLEGVQPVPVAPSTAPSPFVVARLEKPLAADDAADIAACVGRGGRLWMEAAADSAAAEAALHAAGLRTEAKWWLAMDGDEVRAAAPAGDPTAIEWVVQQGWHRPTRHEHRLTPAPTETTIRTGLLLGRGDTPAIANDAVPAWLTELAARQGLSLDGWRAALWDRGDYASQKLVFHLLPMGATTGGLVVRMAQTPEFSARLVNEEAAIRIARELPGGADRAPAIVIRGTHGTRAVLGTAALNAPPFEASTTGRPSCPLAADALGWLESMGRATARPQSGTEVAAALEPLVASVIDAYALEAAYSRALGDALGRLRSAADPIPVVLQHGDATSWNTLAIGPARTAFLDWEFADQAGLPLWDVVYFLVSYAPLGRQRPTRIRHVRHRPAGHFLRPPHRSMVTRWIGTVRTGLGLDPGLIPPLILLLWARQAFKDLPHASPTDDTDNRFARLLRRTVDDPPTFG